MEYRPGKFFAAMRARASAENEQNIFTLKTAAGDLVFKQIAGLIARRVVSWKKAGDRVARGERVGLVRFGSRVDLWLPGDADDLDNLLRMADVALLAAKDAGRGTFRYYFPELEAVTRRDELRREEIEEAIATLTTRERQVMEVLVDGNSNKAIAYLLGASPRTIENHRAKVMAKMRADSLPDLVRMVMASRPSGK